MRRDWLRLARFAVDAVLALGLITAGWLCFFTLDRDLVQFGRDTSHEGGAPKTSVAPAEGPETAPGSGNANEEPGAGSAAKSTALFAEGLREAAPEADPPAELLLMSPEMREEQERGGTWARLFDRNDVQNRFQWIGVIVWALMVTALGWIAFPVLFLTLPALRYRGYGLARIFGLLIWAYVSWLLASLHVLPYTRATLWLVFAVLAGASLCLAYAHRSALRIFIRQHWRSLLTVDLLFVVLFLAWVGVRALNPDLWHPVSGGEKPMDFAYLNAVIKSTWFPPYDPWFAGGQINYYYFGFVMVGSLTKALGIVPSIAYNLAVPLLFALTGVGAYTVANNLAGANEDRGHRAGLWAVALVLVLGNLGEIDLILRGLVEVGNVNFESLIPGYPEGVSAIVGLWRVVVRGKSLPFRPEWWYWDASRLIPYQPPEAGPINEFPAFTFLYADLHAHMMALPLTLAALAIALQWGLGTGRRRETRQREGWRARLEALLRRGLPTPLGSLILGGLVAGSLRATNTWDYPTYLALMAAGFFIGLIGGPDSREGRTDGANGAGVSLADLALGLLTPVALVTLAELLFRPFTASYVGAYAAFELWTGSRTPAWAYLLMYGQFLFPILLGGIVALARSLQRHRQWTFDDLLWPTVVLMAAAVLIVLLVGYFGVSIAWLAVPLGVMAILVLTSREPSIRRRILWFWVGTALALSLLVEVAVLEGDISRMNTVFKFHLQVWMLLGVTSAIFVERLMHIFVLGKEAPATEEASPRHHPRWMITTSPLAFLVMALLLFLTALYPALAIPAKLRDRWSPAAPTTLDGMAYMRYVTQFEQGHAIPLEADYRVIRWLQENVEGSPPIMEAIGAREYLWGNRISVYTGLPSVVGWRWHQVQQRMVMPAGTVERHQFAVRTFYDTENFDLARGILRQYGVRYVILGPYERAYMQPEGHSKFPVMVDRGWLEVVYQDADSTIYRVNEPGANPEAGNAGG